LGGIEERKIIVGLLEQVGFKANPSTIAATPRLTRTASNNP
jgi:hypothetical protein